MKFLVFGDSKLGPIRELSSSCYGHYFDFVEEIVDVTNTNPQGTPKLVINNEFEMDNYQSVILNDSSVIYNYLWSETSYDTNWFSNPFDIRSASNHNFFFNVAKGFKIPTAVETHPSFNSGKITVNRTFPRGKEVRFLIIGRTIHLIGHNYVIEAGEARNLIRFYNKLKVTALLITMIHTLREVKSSGKIKNHFYLKNVESVIDWSTIPEKYAKVYLDHILYESKATLQRR